MKRIFYLVLSLFTALSMCSCASNDETLSKPAQKGENDERISISAIELLGSMRETAVTFPQYEISSSHDEEGNETDGWEDIFTLSLYDDFEAEKVESFAIAYSSQATADEITVVVLKDSVDVEKMKTEMKKRVKSRITMFETYGPDEVVTLENAKIVSKGNCCALIVCDNPEDVAMTFKELV